MRMLVTACAVAGALALGSGTASAQNSTFCHNQATAYANANASTTAGGIGGGAIGAVAGGLLGKALGNNSGAVAAGSIIGGAAGATVGVNAANKKKQQLYDEEYARCMSAAPTPINYPIPPAGSPQWTYQCSLKYKSFVSDTNSPAYGTYQPYANPNGSYPPRQICVLP